MKQQRIAYVEIDRLRHEAERSRTVDQRKDALTRIRASAIALGQTHHPSRARDEALGRERYKLIQDHYFRRG